MKDGPNISRIAALIGDPARANILTALMSGKALTARELADEAGVTPATASTHLARLVDGGLVKERREGRHKYLSLANDDVAAVLEGLMGLAAGTGQLRTRTGPKDRALREARVCYNHLAGVRGVQMYDSLLARNYIAEQEDRVTLTTAGERKMAGLDIDVKPLKSNRSPLCKSCLDWSGRRYHLAGSLGRALLSRFEELGWAHRDKGSRVVRFTSEGLRQFERHFPQPAA